MERAAFTWSCSLKTGDGVTCAARGTDPAEYVTHMRTRHGRRMDHGAQLIRLSKRPPAATLRKLPVGDPLAEITWTEDHLQPVVCECSHGHAAHGPDLVTDTEGGWEPAGRRGRRRYRPPETHWTDPGCTECGCTVADYDIPRHVTTAERRGQFWGAGSAPGTVWVIPFEPAPWEEGRPAPVELHARHGKFTISRHADQRRLIRLADNVARRGVYGVPDPNRSWSPIAGGPHYTWHADPGCPEGSSRQVPAPWFRARQVIAVVLGEYGAKTDLQICRRCIWHDDETAEPGDGETGPADEATTAETETETEMLGYLAEAAVRGAVRAAESRTAGQPTAAARVAETYQRNLARMRADAGMAAMRAHAGDVAVPGSQEIAVVDKTITGDQILRDVRTILRRFAVWPSEGALTLATLFAAASHAKDAETGECLWDHAIKLLITADGYGSGKSWIATLIGGFCPDPTVLVEPTKAALIDLIAEGKTVIVTEVDELFTTAGRNRGIVAVLNASFDRGRHSSRKQGGKAVLVPLFTMMILDGLSTILKGTRRDMLALVKRCHVVEVEKAPAGYRAPKLDGRVREIIKRGQDRLAGWVAGQAENGMGGTVPPLPEGLGNRAADRWEPLFTIALHADLETRTEDNPQGNGDYWTRLAVEAWQQIDGARGVPDVGDDDDLDAELVSWRDDDEDLFVPVVSGR